MVSKASAPGKLILFGEHAVVYGYDALAACLSDLRVEIEVLVCDSGQLTITMPDIRGKAGPGDEERLDTPNSPTALGDSTPFTAVPANPIVTFHWPLEDLCSGPLVQALSVGSEGRPRGQPCHPTPGILTALAQETASLEDVSHRRATAPILFLTTAMFLEEVRGMQLPGVRVRILPPTLPIGAGLGSSAAVSTALSAALLDAHRGFMGARGGSAGVGSPLPSPPCKADLDTINAWAFTAETLFHGSPSGLDNTVSCFGGALVYSRGSGGPKFRALAHFPPLRLLLVNTQVPKDTAALVGGVAARRKAMPGVIDPLLASIAGVVSSALEVLEGEGGQGGDDGEAHAQLARLIPINHSVLGALGVGHPSLDTVVRVAKEKGYAAKLTGAGGGGCAFVLLGGEGMEGELVTELTETHGFHCFTTRVGGEGVLVG